VPTATRTSKARSKKPTRARRSCTKCARPAAPGRKQCRYHLEYFRTYRQKRRAKGRCIHCGTPSAGYQLCDACASRSSDLMRQRYYERRKAGLCVACGAPSRGNSLCAACTKRKARARKAR
jgi:hypothetical protein